MGENLHLLHILCLSAFASLTCIMPTCIHWYAMVVVDISLLLSFACSNARTFTIYISRVHI